MFTGARKKFRLVLRPCPLEVSLEQQREAQRLQQQRRQRARPIVQQRGRAQRESRRSDLDANYAGFDDEGFDFGEEEDAPPMPGCIRWRENYSLPYKERLQRKEAAWQQVKDYHFRLSIESAPANATRNISLHSALKQALEEAACTCQTCLQCLQPLQPQPGRVVPHWSLSGLTMIHIASLYCEQCGESWEAQPMVYDSFGSSPTQPGVVYSNALLQAYRLYSKKGLSASDFCAIQTELQAAREEACGMHVLGVISYTQPLNGSLCPCHLCRAYCKT